MDPTLQSPPRLLSDVFFPIGSAPDEDYFDLLPPLAKDLTPGEAPQDGKGVETGTGTGPGPGPGIWSPLGLPQILEPGSEVAVDPVLLQRAKIQLAARLTMAVQSARESPLGLYQLIFADSQGNDITIGWHHREWNEALLKFRNVMIEAARGSSKTTFLICACLWIIGRNPNIRIKWVGPNEGNVQKRLQFIRSVILQNKLYQLTFPNVRQARDRRLPNNANFLTLERTTFSTEPTIEAKGVLSTGTGDRSDILLGDDLCTEKNTILEPATREKIKHSVLNDWLPTVDPKYGRVWLIFTPWSEEDVNAYLKKVVGSQWFYKKYAHGRPGDPCHSFFPELWPRKALEERLRWLGRVHYSRAYLCMAVSADQVAVNPKDLQPYSQVHIQKRNVDRSFCLISVDPASGKNLQKSSDLDFCGFTVFLFLPPEEKPKELADREAGDEDADTDTDRKEDKKPARSPSPLDYPLILVPKSYSVRLTTRQQVQHLAQLCKTWMPDAIVAEDEGVETLCLWVIEHQQRHPTDITAPIYPSLSHGRSKGQRLLDITPLIERLPTDDAPPRLTLFHAQAIDPESPEEITSIPGGEITLTHNLRYQLLNFGSVKNDDTMDSFTQGLRWIQKHVLPQYQEDPTQGKDQFQTTFVSLG